ncbi:MAG: flagellar biosynthesis protein FlhB [Vulcanibacillus sp.]
MAKLQMNLQYFAGEKTEKATSKKKKESRDKGQVAKTNELPSGLIFLLVFLSFFILGPFLAGRIISLYKKILNEYILWDITVESIRPLFIEIIYDITWIMIPIFIIVLVGALVGNLIQVGFLFTGEPLKFNLEKINPIAGAKKIFSTRALVELTKSILKIVIISYLVISILVDERKTLFSLYYFDIYQILTYIGKLVVELGLKCSILLIILAFFDYLYQKYDHEKKLRMSKQDIKDEYKKSDGDPLIKGKIKQKQRQMAMSRMMQSIPDADVIITNPSHFAVAITYKPDEMSAPKVVAKGMDNIAIKIKEIALKNDISTVENIWLARSLYHQVEIGDSVPSDLYHAVAETLAYVYKIKGLIK